MFAEGTMGSIGDYYEVVEVIGEGAFGIVSKGRDKKLGIPVAIKTIYRSMVNDENDNKFLEEYEMLKNLEHPNIIRTYDLVYDSRKFNLVSELFTGGDLFEKIEMNSPFDPFTASKYLKQILSAMAYSHRKHICHRDLKPENIMFKTPEADSCLAILDYGSANVFLVNQKLTGSAGTPYYVAPEVLRGTHNEKSDVWS